ncbi:MAG: hypothetical protein M3119_05800 [Verrucomicrobiota bacterium]|nr:hypothetical protein [Verrucomicrobiota bacterium]
MPEKSAKSDPLFATTWVHVFEEDTERGAVYRPEEDDIPLSRRPRERIQLRANGSATVQLSGADDRYVEQPAKWSKQGDSIVIQTGKQKLRVVEQSPSRLVVQSQRGS